MNASKENPAMNAPAAATASPAVPTIFGLLAALLVVSVLTGRSLPLIRTDRAALIALALIGLVMCSSGGIGRAIGLYGWAHPITIIGIVLGVLVLVIALTSLMNVRLPMLPTDRAAFIAIAGIAVVKIGVMWVGRLLA